MTSPFCFSLPYPDDVLTLFSPLASRPWALWLDSAGRDRYDIIVAEPCATLVTSGTSTQICEAGQCYESSEEPLTLLRELMSRHGGNVGANAPFSGGALGYFGYDLARRYHALPVQAADDSTVPEMALGIYTWALVVDHHARRCWLAGERDAIQRWQNLTAQHGESGEFFLREPPRSNLSKQSYRHTYARVQDYLRAGDCYQVNLAQRFCARADGDAFTLYKALRRENPAPFAAWLNFPFAQILSASPERFLRVQEGRVETRPIKGTRPRMTDPDADEAQRRALADSAKDRAENLMIVDLLRNDLGKSCATGSVQVPQLFTVESFASVHHLVSTVTGRLAKGQDILDLLRGCFPGGSITGAPKQRAMEIIEELEPHRRGVYCGAIGYIGFDGAMDLNIAIRTLIYADGTICFSAGGGITVDSTPEGEYQESLDKAVALEQALSRFRRY
jgi:para-aminobenzoate synthetase component 1